VTCIALDLKGVSQLSGSLTLALQALSATPGQQCSQKLSNIDHRLAARRLSPTLASLARIPTVHGAVLCACGAPHSVWYSPLTHRLRTLHAHSLTSPPTRPHHRPPRPSFLPPLLLGPRPAHAHLRLLPFLLPTCSRPASPTSPRCSPLAHVTAHFLTRFILAYVPIHLLSRLLASSPASCLASSPSLRPPLRTVLVPLAHTAAHSPGFSRPPRSHSQVSHPRPPAQFLRAGCCDCAAP